ncbi:MAG: hypothetical protein A2687_00820 [Candidatus Levybacteria bacterium RIFCSPHIGHO2_01_FULL_38_26]|nr:MAG: hypothetical protein A2687_00820 [Candidatus Levybacteria bacterium RIFCSPHIGHO2_01_FULL_38_26]
MYSDILGSIKTVDQAREFGSEIDILIESLFKTENNFESYLNQISAHNARMIREASEKNSIDTKNQSMINDYLEGVKEELRKLKTIKITIAFEPSNKSIDLIFTWVSQNLGIGHILDISVEKSILGAAIIEYEGKYEDMSLKKKLDELFERRKEEIYERF